MLSRNLTSSELSFFFVSNDLACNQTSSFRISVLKERSFSAKSNLVSAALRVEFFSHLASQKSKFLLGFGLSEPFLIAAFFSGLLKSFPHELLLCGGQHAKKLVPLVLL